MGHCFIQSSVPILELKLAVLRPVPAIPQLDGDGNVTNGGGDETEDGGSDRIDGMTKEHSHGKQCLGWRNRDRLN